MTDREPNFYSLPPGELFGLRAPSPQLPWEMAIAGRDLPPTVPLLRAPEGAYARQGGVDA